MLKRIRNVDTAKHAMEHITPALLLAFPAELLLALASGAARPSRPSMTSTSASLSTATSPQADGDAPRCLFFDLFEGRADATTQTEDSIPPHDFSKLIRCCPPPRGAGFASDIIDIDDFPDGGCSSEPFDVPNDEYDYDVGEDAGFLDGPLWMDRLDGDALPVFPLLLAPHDGEALPVWPRLQGPQDAEAPPVFARLPSLSPLSSTPVAPAPPLAAPEEVLAPHAPSADDEALHTALLAIACRLADTRRRLAESRRDLAKKADVLDAARERLDAVKKKKPGLTYEIRLATEEANRLADAILADTLKLEGMETKFQAALGLLDESERKDVLVLMGDG